MGFAGPTGLDYSAIEPSLRLSGVPVDRWPEVFEGIRVMEREALDVMKTNTQ